MTSVIKRVRWVGSSRDDLRECPREVRGHFGHALYVAQMGEVHPSAKPLKGFGGAGVWEVIKEHSSGAFRAIYAVRFEDAIYVLHVFQKKSKHGIATPARELKTIRSRLQQVEAEHARSEARP